MEDVVYTPDGGDVFVGDTLRLSCETNGVWLYYQWITTNMPTHSTILPES